VASSTDKGNAGSRAELAALFAAKPALLLALEASWRRLGSIRQGTTPLQQQAAASAIARLCLAAHETTLTAVLGSFEETLLRSNATQQQQQQQQLYALLVTCLKQWLWELPALQQQQQSSEHCMGYIAVAVKVVHAVGGMACSVVWHHFMSFLFNADVSSSSSSSAGSAESVLGPAAAAAEAAVQAAAAPWIALMARCLFVLAAALEAAAAASSALPEPSDAATAPDSTAVVVSLAHRTLQVLLRNIMQADLPAEVLQQLQQQQAAVQELLNSLQAQIASGASADSSSAQQQLRAFAQAVAGYTPLSTACNNLGCMSMSQRSELLLVGGKCCVCARCKAAR
jgi:hypothetical protein